jgi:hypothetical protein
LHGTLRSIKTASYFPLIGRYRPNIAWHENVFRINNLNMTSRKQSRERSRAVTGKNLLCAEDN